MDPADETVLVTVASGTFEDAMACLDGAESAFADRSAGSPRERGEVLRGACDFFVERVEDIARLVTLESGKAGADAPGEARYAADFFRWYAEEAVRSAGHVGMAPATCARIVVHQKPAGMAVLVTPRNYPAAMGARKIGPALAAGCPVVIKPASETPLTMLAFMPILEDAEVPPGIVNVLPSRSSGAVVGAMLADPRVPAVSFTGSTEVGRKLLRSAAENSVKPAMELGGNAPFIACRDADLDAAADGLMIANMRNIGEAWTAASRIYVHEEI